MIRISWQLAVLLRFPFYGYRKLSKALQRAGFPAGEHVARRLLRQLGMSRAVGQVRVQTTDSRHSHPRYPNRLRGLTLKVADQVWVGDITYIRFGTRFLYLAVILDVFTRCVRGWHLSRSLDRELTLTALRRALVDRVPDIHHSDQGVQYACGDYTDLLAEYQVQISMASVGKPEENGYAEQWMRTIKEEEVELSEYQDFHDVYRSIGRFLDEVYTRKRIRLALGYLTPAEFEQDWLAQQPEPVLK